MTELTIKTIAQLRDGFRAGDFPESERYYAEAISLPMYASLSDEEQSQVVDALAQSLLA